MERVTEPRCKVTKEGLLEIDLLETQNCSICVEDHGVLCRVANHPSRKTSGGGAFPGDLVSLISAIRLDQKEQKEEFLTIQKSVLFKLADIQQQTQVSFNKLTPSAACKSENNVTFINLLSNLKLAYGSTIPDMIENYIGPVLSRYADHKFNFKWGVGRTNSNAKIAATDCYDGVDADGGSDEEEVKQEVKQEVKEDEDKGLEKTSYEPFMVYLRTLKLPCADVSEGARCQNKNLFNSDVYTLRSGTTFSTNDLRLIAQAPVFIQNIQGRTDIIILRDGFINQPVYHKAHVRVAVEIKTVEGMGLGHGPLREAATQLIGLNTQNCEITPVVLLTNFVKMHFVLYLTMGSEHAINLKYFLKIVKFKTFESALEFAEDQSNHEPISLHFGRKPTPPSSIAEFTGDEDES